MEEEEEEEPDATHTANTCTRLKDQVPGRLEMSVSISIAASVTGLRGEGERLGDAQRPHTADRSLSER